jgi:hypothetical protein
MDDEKAESLAKLLGGETWNSGGDIWLVILRRADGKIVAISDELVAEYADDEALGAEEPSRSILLV